MEYINKMRGGAVRLDGNSNFLEGVIEMIVNSINITCISYASLKGFIFVIEVDKGKEIFKSITLGDDYYDKPLNKILIKFSILDKNEFPLKKIEIPPKLRISKQTDKEDDFRKEADLQNTIFKTTWKRDNLALCPSVISYHSMSIEESKLLFDIINTKIGSNSIEKDIINYIQSQLINERRLGLIAMEYAENFVLMFDYFNKYKEQKKNIDIAYSLILSNLIILYLECNIVHCDLHSKNVLISNNIEPKKCVFDLTNSCSRIIDFGRITKIEKKTDDKDDIYSTTFNEKESIEFIKRILMKIYNIDLEYNKKNFGVVTPQAFSVFYYSNIVVKDVSGNIIFAFGNNEILNNISTYLNSYYNKVLLNEKDVQLYAMTNNISIKDSFLGILLKFYLKLLKKEMADTKYEYKENVLYIHSSDATNIEKINKIIKLVGGNIRIEMK
jgi:hypothetical protein